MADSYRRRRDRPRHADYPDSNSNSSHSSYDISGESLSSRSTSSLNTFANDGSFLEKFKKMQEAAQAPTSESGHKDDLQNGDDGPTARKRALPFVGKRRGGKVLKTGIVQKPKTEEEEEPAPKDAWARYLAEVRKYREMSCDDEEKTRPLVK